MRDVVNHVGRLRRYARSLCRDQNEADDIVQETLERALRGIEQFRQDGDLRVWLFGILHNVFISRTRAVARSNRHHTEIRSRSDAALLPSQEQSSDLRRVLALVEKLPVEQRQVLLLVSMEGFSTAEIADHLASQSEPSAHDWLVDVRRCDPLVFRMRIGQPVAPGNGGARFVS